MSPKVLPVVVFCRIEFVQRHNLRHNRFLPQVGLFKFSDDRFGADPLPVVVIEDGGTVLCAHVLTLPVQCRRVVDGEENLEDFPIGNLVSIEGQLNRLRVVGAIGADLLVGRIDRGAARVAGSYIFNPIHLLKDGLQAPEAPASKRGDFCCGPLGHRLFSGTNFSAMPSIQ